MSYICVKKLVLILVKWRLSEKKIRQNSFFLCFPRAGVLYVHEDRA